ncbi:MAG TPA: glycosyltransferase family 39 protein [Terriglobales bacterium]|nr:glycosyltransferase family 39 protein [Terriglobales bacterium]
MSFNRERFGIPQLIAAALLLALLGQCAWFIAYIPLTEVEATYVGGGLDYLSHRAVTFDTVRSPLTSLMAATPLRILHPEVFTGSSQFLLDSHRWLIRFPFVLSGLLLGASLWYVARRLYGNTGGYIALGLYAFNPAIVSHISFANPEVITAWGTFGAIFTAIAVAHTLYAPREVVLWNWQRILLLGFCIYLMIGGQFGAVLLLVPGLAFMLWAVPERRGAALVIFFAGVVIGFVFLTAAYLFRPGQYWHGLRTAEWFHPSAQAIVSPFVYRVAAYFYLHEATAATLLFLIALLAYLVWRRARFFGNTAPLLVLIITIVLGLTMPGVVGYGFYFVALPFAMLFSSGVLTDVLENPRMGWMLGIVMGVLLTQAVVGFMGLAHMSRSAR